MDFLRRAAQKLLATPFGEPKSAFPADVRIINLAFAKETQRELLFFKEEIEKFEGVTRYMGNSSQQMAVYGRRPVREAIVFWRKNA